MSDNVERRLNQLTPRGVRPELREQVLAAVAKELQEANGVPLLGTSNAASADCLQHRLCQAVAQASETFAPGQQQGTEEVIGTAWSTDEIFLRQPPSSPWLCRAAIAVAMSLLLGVGLNIWASKESEQRLARIYGPAPISKPAMEIATAVGAITDAQTGQWVYNRLVTPRRPGGDAAAYAKYSATIKRLIDELQTASKDTYHETPKKDLEMDSSQPGRAAGDSTDCQRHFRLDHRFTA
jgi:hypothetical protein